MVVKCLTFAHPVQVPVCGPAHDEVVNMPLMMCKDDFVVDLALWLEYLSNTSNPSFDQFVKSEHLFYLLLLYFFLLFAFLFLLAFSDSFVFRL